MPKESNYQKISLGEAKWKNYPEKLTLLAVFILTIIINVLSNNGTIGKSNADISVKYPTLITPPNYAFAVWGVIYLFWTFYILVQLLPNKYLTNPASHYAKNRNGKN